MTNLLGQSLGWTFWTQLHCSPRPCFLVWTYVLQKGVFQKAQGLSFFSHLRCGVLPFYCLSFRVLTTTSAISSHWNVYAQNGSCVSSCVQTAWGKPIRSLVYWTTSRVYPSLSLKIYHKAISLHDDGIAKSVSCQKLPCHSSLWGVCPNSNTI